MSHTVEVRMIADQIIKVGLTDVNIHNIEVIYVDGSGRITAASLGVRSKYLPEGTPLQATDNEAILIGDRMNENERR